MKAGMILETQLREADWLHDADHMTGRQWDWPAADELSSIHADNDNN